MKLKSIFKKTPVTKPEVKEAASQVKPEVPEGLLKRCNKCGMGIFTDVKNRFSYRKCGMHIIFVQSAEATFVCQPRKGLHF